MRFVIASANPDKAAEMRRSSGRTSLGTAVELVDRPSSVGEVEETGATLEDNARLKAEALCRATGLPAVADDTGLEVDALDGAPGDLLARATPVRARAMPTTSPKLLARARRRKLDRSAVFRTVALVAFPDASELVAEGRMTGTIAAAPRGGGGFGYDPVFVPTDGNGRTLAELSSEEKHAISHRGRAFAALVVLLADRVG